MAYRDGLLLALLAACPLRRRSLALLEVGRHLVRHPDGYRLRLGPAETKNGTAYEAPLPASLAPWLDRYLDEVRPRLLGGSASRAAVGVAGRDGDDREQPVAAGGGGDGAAARAADGAALVPALRGDGPGAGGAGGGGVDRGAARAPGAGHGGAVLQPGGGLGRGGGLPGAARGAARAAAGGAAPPGRAGPERHRAAGGRYTDARPIPRRRAIAAGPSPSASRGRRTSAGSIPGFLPSYTPRALAALTPSGWRPRPSAVSSPAKAAGMSGNVPPAAGPVSTGCSAASSATPSALSSRTMSRRSSTDLAGRPTRVTTSGRVARGNLTPARSHHLARERRGRPHRKREAGARRHVTGTEAEACTASDLRRARSAPSVRAAAPNGGPLPRAGALSRAGRGPPVGTSTRSRRRRKRASSITASLRTWTTRRSRLRRGAGLPSRSTGRRGSPLVRGGVTPGGLLRSAPARRPRPRGALRRWMAWTSRAGRPPAGRRRSSRRLACSRTNYSICTVFGGRRAGFGMVGSWSPSERLGAGRRAGCLARPRTIYSAASCLEAGGPVSA